MYHAYPYQEEGLDALQAVRDQGIRKALVVMATGLGKTVTVAIDVKRFLSCNSGRVLFLCHVNDILYQAKTTFQAVNGMDHTYGYFHGEEKNFHQVDFLFASLQTMERYRELFSPDEFAYVVVDESHHAHADTFRSVIEYFQPQFLLGVTATPDRLDELDIREIFGKEIFSLPLEDAMARGLVTPVDYRLLTDEIQLSEVLETDEGKRVSISYLNRKIFIPRRDEEIASIITRYAAEVSNPRIIIFCASIAHCDHLAQFVPDSFVIHSKIAERERAVKLEMFRQGIVSTVLTVDAFNEGIDIPQANIIVFLRSTTSSTIFLQQLGRGLRKSDGKDKVIVLDFVANCERIKMVHTLWRKVRDETLAYNTNREGSASGIEDPMSLNVSSVEFSEKIVPLLNLMERVRPPKVSDIENLAKEYSEKNPTPASRATADSHQKYWWTCSKCGHEWQAKGTNRVHGRGCPACAGLVATATNNLVVSYPGLAQEYSSKNPLSAENVIPGTSAKLWWVCSKCQYEWQATGYHRIADSGCPACVNRVVWEKNMLAATHPHLAKEYSERNEFLPEEIAAGTYLLLWWKCSYCGHEWQARGSSRVGGSGCPACVGQAVTKENNFAVRYPHVAKEYSSRNKIAAGMLMPGSKEVVWWKCSNCEDEWQAAVYARVAGNGCPACNNRKLSSSNNLAARYPLLVREYSGRNEVPADKVIPTASKKFWWKCFVCHHEWQASAYRRAKGSGCQRCALEKMRERKAKKQAGG